MGRSIIADEKLLPKLKEVSRNDCYNVGLIVGQVNVVNRKMMAFKGWHVFDTLLYITSFSSASV